MRAARGSVVRLTHSCRFWAPGGYRAEAYWRARHQKHGFDLRGVGHVGLSRQQNERMYEEARQVFLDLCRNEGVDFARARMLDIGCGTGFYAQAFLDQGGRHYTGIDITDALFGELEQRFAGFVFRKLDVTSGQLDGSYDLITMIDVSQHIVDDGKFSRALRSIRRCLAPGGVAVVTAWLHPRRIRQRRHQAARPWADYLREFEGCRIRKPVPFRDKVIFTVRER